MRRSGVVRLGDILRLRSKSKKNAKLIAAIHRTGLFDAAYYLENNPDVAADGVDPALHFAQRGWKEGRRPCPQFDPVLYFEQNPDVARAGVNPLLHYAERGRAEGRRGSLPGGTARSAIKTYGEAWAPLPVFTDPRAPPTVTILTDSIAPESVFGGVGTAMVVGAMAARRIGARLRLATRHGPPDPATLGHVLKANRIKWEGATEFVYIPLDGERSLALGDGDVVLTTSWWTTRSALDSAAFGGAQHRQHVLNSFRHHIAQVEAFADDAFDMHVGEQREQGAPEAADIGDEDRLHVPIELRPGHLLDQLFQGAGPARQGDKCVGAVEHRLLALMHAVDNQHLLGGGQRVLLANEEAWDDSGHVAARGERRPSETPHQPFAAAAVDEADALGRQHPPELFRRVAEPRVVAGARSAIDADVSNRAHLSICRPRLGAVKTRTSCKSSMNSRAPSPIRNGFHDYFSNLAS